MEQSKTRFLNYVIRYTPQSQIMRFMALVESDKKPLAQQLAHHFLQLSLNHNLIGCFKVIITKLAIKDYEKYNGRKSSIQDALGPQAVEIKREIVSLGNTGNTKEQSHMQLKLAELLFNHGEYDEVDELLRKIKETGQLEPQMYYPLWVKNSTYNLRFEKIKDLTLKLPDGQVVKPQLREMLIGQDLRNVLQDPRSLLSHTTDLATRGYPLKNDYILEHQLGEYYSLLVLASGQRDIAKKYMPWSSRLEKYYIKMNYKKLLTEVSAAASRFEFDPWINRHIVHINNQIRSNAFLEVLKCYKVVQKELIINELGISQDELEKLLAVNKNSESRYKYDPLTDTVHLSERNNSLVQNLHILEAMLRQQQLQILLEKKEEFSDLLSHTIGMN